MENCNFFFLHEGLPTSVKLVDKETLLKEREEKKKVMTVYMAMYYELSTLYLLFQWCRCFIPFYIQYCQ